MNFPSYHCYPEDRIPEDDQSEYVSEYEKEYFFFDPEAEIEDDVITDEEMQYWLEYEKQMNKDFDEHIRCLHLEELEDTYYKQVDGDIY